MANEERAHSKRFYREEAKNLPDRERPPSENLQARESICQSFTPIQVVPAVDLRILSAPCFQQEAVPGTLLVEGAFFPAARRAVAINSVSCSLERQDVGRKSQPLDEYPCA